MADQAEKMVTRRCTVRFLTPAFLGNAEQSGQWRTPPFKALLRQWWRVVVAKDCNYRDSVIREREGRLFGHAWLESDQNSRGDKVAARKSQMRLRLDRWDNGKLRGQQWQSLPPVRHPEVKFPVVSDLYLGYGPVTLPRGARTPTLKAGAAIQAAESAHLSLAASSDEMDMIEQALYLMDRFGTLGGRSRNGWGSFNLTADSENGWGEPGALPLMEWQQALQLDWPHAIGRDERGALIWQTKELPDWQAVMKQLAEIKIGLRTQFRFNSGFNASHPESRHWLSYPVTRHSVRGWGNSARLPNSLRFKVVADGNLLRGQIVHLPCKPPAQFQSNQQVLTKVWGQVYDFLDRYPSLSRSGNL